LFWLMKGTTEAPPLPPSVEKPVELHIATEQQVKAMLAPAQEPAAESAPEPPPPSSSKQKSKPRKALAHVWQRLENAGTWGKKSLFSIQATQSAQTNLRDTAVESSGVPEGWKPKGLSAPAHGASAPPSGSQLASGGVSGEPSLDSMASPGQASGGRGDAKIRSGPAANVADAEISSEFSDETWQPTGGGNGREGASSGRRSDIKTTGQSNGYAFDLQGPLSGRKIIVAPMPPYPEWAKEQGFEGNVTVYFVVDANGAVRSDVHVRRTSGDPRIDGVVIQTVKTWRFAPLAGAKGGEQWGLATFRFRLHG
jgi:TonB family protein